MKIDRYAGPPFACPVSHFCDSFAAALAAARYPAPMAGAGRLLEAPWMFTTCGAPGHAMHRGGPWGTKGWSGAKAWLPLVAGYMKLYMA